VSRLFAPVFTIRSIRALHNATIDRGLESPFDRWIGTFDGASDDGKVLVSVDVTETIERGRDALRAHRTQIDPDGFWFRIPTELVTDVYPFEDFELLCSTAPLPAGAADLFAGL